MPAIFRCDITGSAIALHCCKAHSKINRKMGNLTPCKIVTPENIILKLCTRNYVGEVTRHANFGFTRYSGVFSPNRQLYLIRRIYVFQSLPILVVVVFAQQHMETCRCLGRERCPWTMKFRCFWTYYLEHFAIDPTCIDHCTWTVSEWTNDNAVLFGLRDMTRRFGECLGR